MTYRAENLSVLHSVDGLSRLVASVPDEKTAQMFAGVLNSEHGTATAHDMWMTVYVRNVYGRDLAYPADDKAIIFAALLGVKTFNTHQIHLIKALGYAIHVAAGQLPREVQITRF